MIFFLSDLLLINSEDRLCVCWGSAEDRGLPARCALQLLGIDVYLVPIAVVDGETVEADVEGVSMCTQKN